MSQPKKIIFDVGANDCQTFLQEVKDNASTHVHAFEPTPKFSDFARNNYHHLKNFHYIPFGVSDKEEILNFKIAGHADWGCSSFLDFSENSKTLWEGRDDFDVTDSVNVLVIPLSKYIEENKIPKIDFLHVDTQGFDLKVLRGLGKYISIVKEGMVEAAAKPDILYYGQNTLEETKEFLEKNGFKIISITNNDHLGNEVNIHFVRENKIKIFIVTYNNPKMLNQCVKSIFFNTGVVEQSNIQVYVINNHSNFELDEAYQDKVTVFHNVVRPDFSTGHLSRSWNQAIINGFVDLNNPHCDILITCQDDTLFSNHFIQKIVELHKQYDFFTCGAGDNFVSYTPNAIKRIGLWDERYCGIAYQEKDYFTRAYKYHKEKSSINDYYHDFVHNPVDYSQLPIKFIPTGFERMDKNHLASEEYHISGAQIYFLKWGFGQEDILIQIDEGKPKLPSFVLYPYFEKDVETLIEQNFIFKFSNGYSNNG
jgi:FkbM family methyltransferase